MKDNISRKNAQSYHEAIPMEKHAIAPTVGTGNSTTAATGDPHATATSCCLFPHPHFMHADLLSRT